MNKINTIITFIIASILLGCGSLTTKYASKNDVIDIDTSHKEIDKTFYLIGDAGDAEFGKRTKALTALKSFIAKRNSEEDYAIFLGDNIYDRGLVHKNHKNRRDAEHKIDVQLDVAKFFAGTSIFIPGNHDWYSNGLKGLNREEEYIKDALKNKKAFLPKNGCPVKSVEISNDIELLVLDTQWFITDWDKHPTINDECEIKSREAFFLEIEGELKKNNEKTILIAMHHPAFTYASHGGYFNVKKHIFPFGNSVPLPGLGTLVAQIRSQGGVSPQDRYNNRYNELMQRLITLTTNSDRVIFASGHEHALQYIENEGIKQIVSGAGSKQSAVALGEGAQFVSGQQGFAVLEVYKDKSSVVRFYSADEDNSTLLFAKQVHEPEIEYDVSSLPTSFGQTIETTVYPEAETHKSSNYKWFFGEHYRDYYGTKITAKVATLDTLMGGMTVVRKGGGHQTRALRLNDKRGRNYNLRAVKKSAVQFLQTTVFKSTYVTDDFKETLTEDLILDFYTSSHPFAPFTIPALSDAIGIYHANPQLLYIPKHAALGKYNEAFGDELYVLVERPDKDFIDEASFGKPTTIESTSDVFKKLRKDEKYQIDEEVYIKERIFDMLLGDWDRHQDQWRWARFDDGATKKYRPIPRDRDQVFSKYDGALLDLLNLLMPVTKQFQVYDEELKNIKWINLAGIGLDRTFAQTAGREEWLSQAAYIQENLTDEVIDDAFTKMPVEVQGGMSDEVKEKLKARRDNLSNIVAKYYDYLSKLVVITGTDKDDQILIQREDDKTTVTVSRIKKGEAQAPYKTRVIHSDETKEIWLYALDDDDRIIIRGSGKRPVRVRVIGGQNNDSYDIENGRKVTVYDYKTKPNTIVKKGGAIYNFSNIYDFNKYHYNKRIETVSNTFPAFGFNPDDGFKIGVTTSLIVKKIRSNPFSNKHSVSAGYFFATSGFDISYEGEFVNVLKKWNLFIGARITSENFSRNFFGFGNETTNIDDDEGLDYNRVKTGIRKLDVGLAKNGNYGGRIAITGTIESIEVQETPGRFINDFFTEDTSLFDSKLFGSLHALYTYSGYDNKTNTKRGMFFKLKSGITTNTEDTDRTFGYLNSSLEFFNSLTRNKRLVLRTKGQGQLNIGDNYEFYQAAILGADTGLRSYRRERFSGESTLAFTGDLSYSLFKFKTALLPLNIGVFGGGDYGRVWQDGEDSNTWYSSYGGGLTVNALDAIVGNLGIFTGDEGARISFKFLVGL